MASRRVGVALLAGGIGRRMGGHLPKPLLQVLGHPLIHFSIRVFESIPEVKAIRIAINPLHTKTLDKVLAPYPRKAYKGWTHGGSTRAGSALNALRALEKDGVDTVLVHDAARPCLEEEDVRDLLDALPGHDGAILTAPTVNTIWKTEGDRLDETLPREDLAMALTPQAFPYDTILDALTRGADEGFQGPDDASYVRRLGGEVVGVKGSRWNIKVTYPEDLSLVKVILSGGVGCA